MENSKEFTKRLVQALFYQLTQGCNNIHCGCEFCKSCPTFKYSNLGDPNSIACQAILFAQNYKAHLCCGVPPSILHPEYYEVSEKFTSILKKLISVDTINFDTKEMEEVIESALSSPEQFEHLFSLNRNPISIKNYDFDDEFVDLVGDSMYVHPEFFSKFREVFSNLFTNFISLSDYNVHWLRGFLILPAFRFFFDSEDGKLSPLFELLIIKIMTEFSDEARGLLFEGLKKYPRAARGYLQMCQLSLTFYILTTADDHVPIDDRPVLLIQGFLLRLRKEMGSKRCIQTSEFYNDPYSEQYIARVNATHAVPIDQIFDCMAILNLEVKYEILSGILQKNQKEVGFRQLLRQGQLHPDDFELTVEVRRDHLLEDALEQFSALPTEALQRRLKIKFKGEDAIDIGGVSREFFYLITEQLFSPDHGMFEMIHNTFYWFMPGSIEETREFQLLGTVIGLAIYNRVILPIRFPIALYKKLKNEKLTLEDIREIDEQSYKSLVSLIKAKENGEDISGAFLTFVGSYMKFDQVIEEELIEGGAAIDVTNDNLDEYIECYIDWFLNKSINRMFSAFKRGFDKLCDRDIFNLFTPDELQVIVSGEEVFDWPALKAATTYCDGYDEDSRAVKWFWEIFDEFSEKQKLNFLLFSTGTDNAPVGGLAKSHLVIQRTGDPEKLPVAHTCFNIFALPDYESKEKMKRCILISLEHIEGFGLK